MTTNDARFSDPRNTRPRAIKSAFNAEPTDVIRASSDDKLGTLEPHFRPTVRAARQTDAARQMPRRGKRTMENAPIVLDRPVEAWNVDGSASAVPEGGSFIQDAMRATGRRVGRCSFRECDRPAVVGGHVWISRREGAEFGRPFIAPICRQCNSTRNARRMQGAGARLRASVAVTPVAVTPGMREAERRVVEREGTSESESETGESEPESETGEWESEAESDSRASYESY